MRAAARQLLGRLSPRCYASPAMLQRPSGPWPALARLATVCALVLAPGLAVAQFGEEYAAERQIADRFAIRVGGFAASFNTTVQFSKGGLVGTSITAENELGLDSTQGNVRVEGHYRFARKHRVSYGLFQFTRDAVNEFEDTIIIGDEEYEVGALVESQLDTGFVKLSYNYSVINTGRFDFGFSAGLSILDAEFAVGGAGAISGGGEDLVGDGRTSGSFRAPVPVFGNFVEVRLGPRVFYRGDLELFTIRTGDIRGSQIDARVAIDWYPFRYIGFGIGYNFLRIDFEQSKGKDSLLVDYRIDGTIFYFSYIF